MPFTFAHPAAVLPIHSRFKQWVSLPALVVGSMVPDAAYYLPLPANYKESAHTFLGVLFFGLPVGILMLLLFYWVAPEVVYLLPSPYREVLQPSVSGNDAKSHLANLRQAWLAICGLAIGAETHILWDSFTHDSGWAVLHLSFLQERLWGNRFFVYNVLEFLSSVVGLWIVLYFCDRWMKERGFRLWTPPQPSWRLYLWLGVLTGCLAEAVIESHTVEVIARLSFLRSRHYHFALILFTSFVRNLLIALIALPVAVKTLRRPSGLRDTIY